MSDTAAILVTYQSEGVIGGAVDSCLAAGLEVVVVDNASTDGTVAEVKKRPVKLLANSENLGFAGGVNQGIRATTKPFILLLNPDAALLGGEQASAGIERLEAACCMPGVAAATGKLLDAAGEFQSGFSVRRFPSPTALAFEVLGLNAVWPRNPVNARYRYADLSVDEPGFVEQPAAAFLLLRRDVWQSIGGFDERFHPVWFEDVDFCKRLSEAGWKIRYEPAVTVSHHGGHSARQLDQESKAAYWYASLLKYAAKHFPRRAHAAVSLAVVAGGVLRLLTGIVQQISLRPIGIYAKVIRLACRSMLFGGDGKRNTSGKGKINRTRIHGL